MFTIKGVAYPEKIENRLARLRHDGAKGDCKATAAAANLSCGSFVRFSLTIDIDRRTIDDAAFSSNGCGFMIAAADSLAESIIKKGLPELHGLVDADLNQHIQEVLGEFPLNRHECAVACTEALRAAFADHRARRVEEFQGEKALICTCFGVSEETIETIILNNSLGSVDEITNACNAGGGCGSCRLLIQEMLDERFHADAS